MKNNFSVYMHIFPNNKKYVGITSRKLSERFHKGGGYGGQSFVYNAIKKYGWDNIQHILVATGLTKDQACQKEIELIKKFDLTNRNKGYNRSTGGEFGAIGVKQSKQTIEKRRQKMIGHKTSEETKKKISESNKAALKKYYKEHPEAIERISNSLKGKSSWNKGKKLSESHLKHLSDVRKGKKFSEERKRQISERLKGHKTSEETKKKISESLLGKKMSEEKYNHLIQTKLKLGIIKPILDIDNNITYITLADIAKKYNVSNTVIRNALKNKRTVIKMNLRYLTDEELKEISKEQYGSKGDRL